ncbi:MAG: class I mannose-6-phosphate isomerase [Prevotella sp.]|jgi:mannose-6-phosphate isomerase|nr:class I mannose-6-phosphate isomerase [Prevotella sp.]MBQ5494429.1 class I mannose-6-phosphate isomerase [Prevotella sp.]MBQ5548781.1 class I mannose-6-phosphate isomerase [Prevotella sp.]
MINYYKFTPLVKTLIWGTESWQISGVPGNETPCDGQKLNDLVKALKGQLVGEANYQRFGDEFPLLIKFIDAHQDLSIQVHPTDEIAHRQGKPRGKTEMWYVMDSQPTAKLYNGLKMQITPDQYKEMVANDTICDALAQYHVHEGDCFFIPAGRIHAIGAGCYLAEIQQTSDVTYRIYDYKRRDKDGNLRQLHTQEAAESINYTVLPDYRQHYTPQKNEGQLLVECPYFNTAVYDLTEPMTIDYSELDSFVILIGLKGEGLLSVDGEEVPFRAGETLLIPATAREVRAEGTIKFLETYVLS